MHGIIVITADYVSSNLTMFLFSFSKLLQSNSLDSNEKTDQSQGNPSTSSQSQPGPSGVGQVSALTTTPSQPSASRFVQPDDSSAPSSPLDTGDSTAGKCEELSYRKVHNSVTVKHAY